MLKIALKGLLARKLRLFTTGLAVVLGVAFMAGTLVFTDTISRTFDTLFATVGAGVDAEVRGPAAFDDGFGGELRPRIDAALVDTVASVEGVAAAEGLVENLSTRIVGDDGKAVGNPAGGAPTFGRNWVIDEGLNPFELVEGRAPESDDEVVLDAFTAEQGELAVGARTAVLTPARSEVTVVGIARFGDTDSPGGSTNVMFTYEAAQRLLAEPGRIDVVEVRAEQGVSETDVRDAVAAAVPSDLETITGEQLIDEEQEALSEGIGGFRTFLLGFALIALFVGIFVIYNTFNIVVAQRTREMALLRAVGAGRGQVLGSVLLESMVVGLIAGGLGLLLGIGIAAGLKALFGAIGLDLPSSGLVVTPTTVVVAFVVGVVVSVVSALVPAVRASRVPPIAAMRDVDIDRSGRSVVRIVVGALVTLVGVGLVALGLFGDVDDPIPPVGIGALVLVIGIAVLGPLFAAPLSRFLGAPLPALRGTPGTLARENAARNPGRTATTASALMIGVALVAFISVVAASFKASFQETLTESIRGDFVLDSGSFDPTSGLPPELTRAVDELPEVETASGVRLVFAEVDGEGSSIAAIDPRTAGELFDVSLIEGRYQDLDETGIAVFEDVAEEDGLALGDTVPVRFIDTGVQQLSVRAIYENDDLAGRYLVGTAVSDANVTNPTDFQVFVQLAAGVSAEEGRAAIQSVADAYPTATVQDQSEYREAQTAPIDQILFLVYALLAFAVIIALIGIANTLVLSVYERTRELGLLRAVGMTRPQVRSMVRWESVIIALLGTVLGLAIGGFFGWATMRAAVDAGFGQTRIPVLTLVIIAVVAAVAGVLAALRPASRAAKADVLRAISSV